MNFRKINQILKNKKTGAILIEFAFAIPVLVAILYFILDGPGLRLYQLKLKNTAYFAVNLIQNLTDQREDKFINVDDLKRVTLSAFGNIYRSNTMLKNKSEKYPFGHHGHIYLWCIFGNEDGKTASVKWVWESGSPGKTPAEFSSSIFTSADSISNSIVKFGKSVPPTYIHKDLVINPGETKMILEVSLVVYASALNSSGNKEEEQTSSGTNAANNTENNKNNTNNSSNNNNKEEQTPSGTNAAEVLNASKQVRASGAGKLGFYMLPLKPMIGTQNSYLNYIAIFTPKPGLFSFEKAPDGSLIPN